MNKNVKTAVIVVGIAVLAFMLMSFSKKPAAATLSDEDKNNLFATAKGPQPRGAQMALTEEQEMALQAEIQKERDYAMQKIKEYGLEAEYEAYLKSRENEPLLP
jgi:hypothetical protein